MAAVVRRLSSITSETVVSRRASCEAPNLAVSTCYLEVKPEISEKRRASMGMFDGKPNTRASLCVPNYNGGQPSVACLSRKRTSLDDIFLTEWMQQSGVLKNQIELDKAVEIPKKKPSYDGWQNDCEQHKIPSLVLPVFVAGNDSSLCISSDASSNASFSSVFNHSPLQLSPNCTKPQTSPGVGTYEAPLCQIHDNPCDHVGQISCCLSPSTSRYGLSKSHQDPVTDNAFFPHLPSICRTPKHLGKNPTYNCSGPGHIHESSSPYQNHLHHLSCSRAAFYGTSEICSLKVRNGHRKRSFPSIVFPSLSLCIETKTKADPFTFENCQEQGNDQLIPTEEIQEQSVREQELTVDAELSTIPKIHIETVYYGNDDFFESKDEYAQVSANVFTDKPHENPSLKPPGMQCCRRRLSLEVQPYRVLKKDKLGSFVSQPLTPQSWQLHGHSFYRHKRLSGSELYGNSNNFSNSILKREATLGYMNLILKPVGSVINRGGFGVVKLGHFKGKCVAVKVLKGKRPAQSAVKEALLLKIQPQAHINSTYAVVTSSASKGFANIFWSRIIESSEEEVVPLKSVSSLFGLSVEDALSLSHENEDCIGALEWAWVVNELCAPYTLLTLINDPSIILSARDKVRFIGEIANGLTYLHSQNIVHLDVKPANTLLSQTGHVKLADFGCCADLCAEKNELVLGTINYQAPEVLRGEEITDRCDVFSLGITAWHLLTQVMPFQGIHPHVIIYQVTKLFHRPVDHFPILISSYTLLEQLLNGIAERCWAEDPEQRPSASVLSANLTALYHSPAT
ncbi:uncharacterized protein [Macrobrachium rosenbergii]|uniref:uncharacterized protein n=1 Tax=Macrobrachium rosenbergii TaxID=79674 RepID=UPI0034D40DB2